MLGETISHYQIIEKLGEGGMGLVYRARDTKLERDVALKLLPPHLSSDPEAVKRFVQEAKAASALNHSAIGVIHEIDETDDGQTFIAMALYEGGTLRDRIDSGKLTTEEAVTIASQIASGLARAHEMGIVHRDIKPQNILLTRDGEAKIIDFGLAKLAGKTKLTRDGSTLGTAAYMSPEQARGEEVGHRSDIFSLGTILYEMLSGETPFRGEHEAALLYGIVHEEPEEISEKCGDIDSRLCDLIVKALKKNPAERYQSAGEMKNDLVELRSASASSEASRTSASRAAGGRSKRNFWIGIGAVAAIAVIVGYLVISRREPIPLTAAEMSIAVVDFRGMSSSVDTITQVMFNEYLITAMIDNCPIRVKTPEYVRECRRQLFGSTDPRAGEGRELDIARRGGATHLLSGSIGAIEAERVINWRLVDVVSGDGLGAGVVRSDRLDTMVDKLVDAVVDELAGLSGDQEKVEQVPVKMITSSSVEAYEHYITGRLKYAAHKREDAGEEYEKAVELDSTFALAYLELARMYFGSALIRADITIARRYANAALRHEENLGAKSRLHLKAFQHGLDYEVEKEISTYREILDRWPEDRETLRMLGGRAFWWWYNELCIEVNRAGTELYPDDQVLGGALLSSSLRNKGMYQESLNATRAFLDTHPTNPNIWDELALSYLSLGYPDSAETAYRKALELDPDWGKQGFAYCAFHKGDIENAVSILEQYFSEEDISDDTRFDLASNFTHVIHLPALYFEAGRYFDAFRIMEDARRYMGEDPSFWQYQAGMLYLSSGMPDRALSLVREMEESDEIRVQIFAYRFKGLAQAAAGDITGAKSTARYVHELAETIGPMMSYAAFDVEAKIAIAEKDPSAALEALRRMNSISASFSSLKDIYRQASSAEAFEMAGEFEKAVAQHEELLRLYGGHALSHYDLGRLYERLDRAEEAVAHYTRFIEMWKNADEGLPQPEHARERLKALGAI